MTVVVYGGSGSGKSAWAEDFCTRLGKKRLYLATMRPCGEEARERIARHRQLRAGKGFDTLEYYEDIRTLELSTGYDCLLIEDAGNLVSEAIFYCSIPWDEAVQQLYDGLFRLSEQVKHLVLVTNDVFSDGIAYDNGTADFVRCLSGLNRFVASKADAMFEVVCGLSICHKGEAILP